MHRLVTSNVSWHRHHGRRRCRGRSLGRGRAHGQAQTIKIGILYDHTGPFSAAGSLNCWRGAKMIIDYMNEKGGVLGKYKIVQVDGDSQSKAEVAINEAERLLNVEKVDILAGVYSSAHAVPLAEKVDKQKRFLWITTAISSKVFDGRNLQYTFRPAGRRASSSASCPWPTSPTTARASSRRRAKDLRLAIIYEDGAYGADVGLGNELKAKELGLNVVLKEGYSINAPDLSSLVTKLRSVRPDVLFHTGYNPDISLFLRQAKEQGLRVRAYIGHGAGHSQLDKLKEAFGKDVEWFHTLDPIASQLLDREEAQARRGRSHRGDGQALQGALRPQRADQRHRAPRVHGLQQHVDPAQRRGAARHPEARRLRARRPRQGRARDRHPRGRHHAGLRREVPPARATVSPARTSARIPAVFQIIESKFELVYPKVVATAQPVLPLPASSPFAAR